MKGFITNIQRFSVHDGRGIRTTVFLKGCPLSCIWCQNPETITDHPDVLHYIDKCLGCGNCIDTCPHNCFIGVADSRRFDAESCNQCGLCVKGCPEGALAWSSREVESSDVMKEVVRDKVYYELSGGGLTISGGEPLFQPDFCVALASKAKAEGISVALDTSGYAEMETVKELMPIIDLFLYDIKFIDSDLHRKFTGKSNRTILRNFQVLISGEANVRVRVPLVPGVNDDIANLSQIKAFVEKYARGTKIDLIPFNGLATEKYQMLGIRAKV